MINKKIFKCICILTFALAIIVLLMSYVNQKIKYKGVELVKMSVLSEDKMIRVTWDGHCKKNECWELSIYSNQKLCKKIQFNRNINRYEFKEGEHGELYSFELTKKADSNIGEQIISEALFIDFSKIPNIPLISIVTRNEKQPNATKVIPPEGYWGQSITNNHYVDGYMMYISEDESYSISSEAKIKIRGNTSAAGKKKPYKIKLEKEIDLSGKLDDSNQNDEWILLSCGTSLNTSVGNIVSTICRNSWQPEGQFVNLMLNGDWKGCYYLIENIEKNESKCDVSNDGFIIENDPYWWNGEVNYFKSSLQYEPFRYTINYPDGENVELREKEDMREYLDKVENMIYSGDIDFLEMIDENSFVTWVISHDLLGTTDFAGSNMYLYNYNYITNDLEINQLKMGPLWDFDSILYVDDSWSSIHHSEVFYYRKLFEYQEFKEIYKQEWSLIKKGVIEQTMIELDKYLLENEEALQESWNLDASRWNTENSNVKEQRQYVEKWLYNRSKWISEHLDEI